uniref:Myb/SANT-like domain-containing protein n=1 Tax=Nelumbo nucifera TaxID=4432 RepID=A0A822Z2B7_NELNU|nr:TPA_asm: hypothetical protein HUJ06_008250 [Nelumbo nucifera]
MLYLIVFTPPTRILQKYMAIQVDKMQEEISNEFATWCEAEEMTFIDLMVEQVKAHNRPTLTFNLEGWKNIVEKFNQMHHKSYS